MKDLLHRQVEIEATRGKSDDVVRLSFVSELPVDRGGEMEILDMGNADMKRLNGSAPLLLNHNPDQWIGRILRAWVEAGRGYAEVKFGSSQLAQDLLRDLKNGVVTTVSCGYRRTKAISEKVVEGIRHVRYAAEFFEVSLCSIPADASVGFGRSNQQQLQHRIEMNNSQTDSAELLAIGRALNGKINGDALALAQEAIERGTSVADFRRDMMSRLPNTQPLQRPVSLDISSREIRQYSLGRAIADFAEKGKLEGFEREMDQECARVSGMSARGFWIPREALANNYSRSLVAATSSIGGALVPSEHLGDEFIQALRARAMTMQLGVRMLTGLQGNIEIPKQTGTSTVNWRTEIQAASETYPTFGKISLTPKAATVFVTYGRQLLIQGVPAIDQLVRDDIIQGIAQAIDRCVLAGIGSAEPAGIIKVAAAGGAATLATGVNQVTLGANGGAISYDALVSLEAAIAADNADTSGMKFLTNPTVRGFLRKKLENTVSGQFCWTIPSVSNNPTEGRLLGYPAYISTNAPANITTGTVTTGCSAVYLGSWDNVLLGSWGPGLDILTDIYTAAGTRQIKVYGTHYCDVGIRNGEAFGVITDITS